MNVYGGYQNVDLKGTALGSTYIFLCFKKFHSKRLNKN